MFSLLFYLFIYFFFLNIYQYPVKLENADGQKIINSHTLCKKQGKISSI